MKGTYIIRNDLTVYDGDDEAKYVKWCSTKFRQHATRFITKYDAEKVAQILKEKGEIVAVVVFPKG